ncbi:MAG: hypothetical protein GY794_04230, partial [bacterium]|nr:hypothetical protein [bacterium]
RLIGFGASVVVPGHGPLCTTGELVRWVEYYDQLRETIANMAASGKSDSDITEAIAPPDDMHGWWRFEAWKHADSVSKVLASVRQGALEA